MANAKQSRGKDGKFVKKENETNAKVVGLVTVVERSLSDNLNKDAEIKCLEAQIAQLQSVNEKLGHDNANLHQQYKKLQDEADEMARECCKVRNELGKVREQSRINFKKYKKAQEKLDEKLADGIVNDVLKKGYEVMVKDLIVMVKYLMGKSFFIRLAFERTHGEKFHYIVDVMSKPEK